MLIELTNGQALLCFSLARLNRRCALYKTVVCEVEKEEEEDEEDEEENKS